ncbi:MAG: hypothetical protein NC347_07625 [Clostridium sp.]|nr:hypothetical protein [Clostridium sp.]
MNNFFDYNTEIRQYDGSAYEQARTGEALWQEWLDINKQYEKQITNYAGYLPFSILPFPLQFLTVLGMILLVPYIPLLVHLPNIGEIMKNSPDALWGLIIGLGICVFGITILLVLYLIIMKILNSKKDHTGLRKEKNRIQKKIFQGLHIPTDIDCYPLDVLSVEYGKTVREKQYKHRYKASTWTCFFQNDTLYITDHLHLFAMEIPKLQLSYTAGIIYMANSTARSDTAGISCFIPGYYKIEGYGSIQIYGSNGQFEILVPAYDWDNGIKKEIEAYREAAKVHFGQKELVFYWDSDCFFNENITWDEDYDCCVRLKPKTLQDEDMEQVKADFLAIMRDTAAWNKKLLPLIEQKTGKGEKAYRKNEIGLLGFFVESAHKVSFWYDIPGEDDDYIEVSGNIEEDVWTVSRKEECKLLD